MMEPTRAELDALASTIGNAYGRLEFDAMGRALVLCGERPSVVADWIAQVSRLAALTEIITRDARPEHKEGP